MSDCLFCRIAAGEEPAHVVRRTDEVTAFLDTRPLFAGHTLVVPNRHVDDLTDLPPDLREPLLAAVQHLARAMVAALGAQGSFVATNNVVSQSVPHLHVHVVPRTKGDGLRGFFWPRTTYADDAEAAACADRLGRALPAVLE